MFGIGGATRPVRSAVGKITTLRWGWRLGLIVIAAVLIMMLGIWLLRSEEAAYFASTAGQVGVGHNGDSTVSYYANQYVEVESSVASGVGAQADVDARHAVKDIEDKVIRFETEILRQNVSGQDYFVNYRLNRDQFRQETKAMLSQILNSSVEKSGAEAQEKWLELSTKILQEEEIENLLKIKGFSDVVADVLAENVTVIVYAQGLTTREMSVIQDIVVRVTNVRIDNISISYKQ